MIDEHNIQSLVYLGWEYFFQKVEKYTDLTIWEDSVIINACFQIVTTEISSCGKLMLNEVSFPHM